MVSLRIELPEGDAKKLSEIANERHISPEELVLSTIRDLLSQPDEVLEEEIDYLLKKHHELLKRLA